MTDAFTQAWNLLKALPEQQMFVERTPRENVVDDYELNYENRPEIDRYGARSLGTVHPAILCMLQRRTDDYHGHKGISPNLNLDMGRDIDMQIDQNRKEHAEIFGSPPMPAEEYHEAGMSIAQGPEFNRAMYNQRFFPVGSVRTGYQDSDKVSHNPDRAARGGPFDSSRFINQYPEAYRRNMSGYGLQPSHKITHPTREEMRG